MLIWALGYVVVRELVPGERDIGEDVADDVAETAHRLSLVACVGRPAGPHPPRAPADRSPSVC